MKKPISITKELNNKVQKRNKAEEISLSLKNKIERFSKENNPDKKLVLAHKILKLGADAQSIEKEIGTNIGSSQAKKIYGEVELRVLEFIVTSEEKAAAKAIAAAKAEAEAEEKAAAEKAAAEAAEVEAAAEQAEEVVVEAAAEQAEEVVVEADVCLVIGNQTIDSTANNFGL